jgi:chromate transporter
MIISEEADGHGNQEGTKFPCVDLPLKNRRGDIPTETAHAPDLHQGISLPLLFGTFLRMGITAFGGPAMIAYIRKMAVGRKKWIDGESFQDGVALCQTIPGATVMQMAAYIGLKVRGVRGAVVSYIGFVLPAFLLIFALSVAYARAHELPAVIAAFSGLQAVIVAVVANATLSFGKTSLKSWKNVCIAFVAAALFWLMANPVLIILLAALLGMLLNSRQPATRSVSHSGEITDTFRPLLLFLFFSALGLALLFFLQKELFQLAVLMSKIDLIAFGGAFASVPLMFHEVVEARSWMDAPTFLNGIVLGQFTPGPIVITATFVGYLVYGPVGALIATIAIFLPSFLILIGIAPWFDRMRSSPWFTRAIGGILCSFVGLLFTVTIRFALNVHWDWLHLALAGAALAALLLKLDILWVVLAGTAVSILVF